jgi:hypothetical protein
MLLDQLEISARQSRAELIRELEHWRARAQPPLPGKTPAADALPRHHSQLERVGAQMIRLADRVDVGPWDGAEVNDRIDRAELARRSVQKIHAVWDFFRRKIALRDLAEHRAMLEAADDFAWACFLPARIQARKDGTRDLAPPLVFFAEDRSPFTQARGMGQGLAVEAHTYGHLEDDLRDVTAHLPVPVIGLPWRDAKHLPSLVHVAHEVGHVVAHDLTLVPDIQREIAVAADVDPERAAAWSSWASEVFADFYAVACAGEPYVTMLALESLGPRGDIRTETIAAPKLGRYATRFLRLLVCDFFREKLGHAGGEGVKAYRGLYEEHAMAKYEADIAGIFRIVDRGTTVTAAFGRSLSEVLAWPEDREQAIDDLETNMGQNTVSFKEKPIEAIVLSAVRAFRDDPKRFDAKKWEWLLDRLANHRRVAYRSRDTEESERQQKNAPAVLQGQIEADRARDDSLASLLGLRGTTT